MKKPTLEELIDLQALSQSAASYINNHSFYRCHDKEKGYARIDEIFEWIKSKSKLEAEEL